MGDGISFSGCGISEQQRHLTEQLSHQFHSQAVGFHEVDKEEDEEDGARDDLPLCSSILSASQESSKTLKAHHGDRDYPQYPGSGGGGGLHLRNHRLLLRARGGASDTPCAMTSSIPTAENAGCIALTLPERRNAEVMWRSCRRSMMFGLLHICIYYVCMYACVVI